MPRVRGEVPSSSRNAHAHAREPYGYHGAFDPLIAGKPFVKRTGHYYNAIPRPYKSGIVGSRGEVDWSVRSSYLPVGLGLNLKRYGRKFASPSFFFLWGNHTQRRHKLDAGLEKRPPKGFCFFADFNGVDNTDDMVRSWTRFANMFGIKYHGDRYYTFPKGMIGSLDPRSCLYYETPYDPFVVKGDKEYEFLKMTGVISHKRSEISRLRRAAKRGVTTVVKPLCVSDLLGPRKAESAKAQRIHGTRKSTKEVLSVLDKRGRCRAAPSIVISAIIKIFTRVKTLQVYNIPGMAPCKEMPSTLRHTVYKPPHRRIAELRKESKKTLLKKGAAVDILHGIDVPLQASTIPFVGEQNATFGSDTDDAFCITGPSRKGKTARLKRDTWV